MFSSDEPIEFLIDSFSLIQSFKVVKECERCFQEMLDKLIGNFFCINIASDRVPRGEDSQMSNVHVVQPFNQVFELPLC